MLPDETFSFQHFIPYGSAPKVLVVEQNEDVRYCIRECLKNQFTVVEAETGQQAWTMILELLPHVVVAEMQSQPAGLTLCQQMKQDVRTSDIPFIATGHSNLEAKINSLQQGADDYLIKPFYFNELEIRIRNLIHLRERLRDKYKTNSANSSGIDSLENNFLKKAIEVIERNINQAQFGVPPLASEMGMSQVQLYRKMVSASGVSPNDFIRHVRLNRAAKLLEQKTNNVSDVAYQVGFNSLSYFSKCFKKKFGCNPIDFLKQVA
jgi:YesN/AraC family two-component response regulator